MQRLLLGCLALLTVAIYIPGLSGPFLFDDTPNILRPMQAWLDGQTGWQEFVFGNRSGPLGRFLSTLTFAANGATTGLDVIPFKLTNLTIHLGCGGLLYVLVSSLLKRDRLLADHTRGAALAITAVWLLHPMQVSTVLYVVQRMAQLSTFFSLLALIFYVIGRTAIEEGRRASGIRHLFLFIPAATVAAALGKENGILVPLLCAVLELAYFRVPAGHARPWEVRSFFLIFLALPALLALFIFPPAKLLAGYEGRLFTLGERLLTQPRVLMDYAGTLLVPTGPALGVYTDDFTISKGLFSPPSTLWALLGLGAWIGAAVALRKRIPAFFCGTGLFLTAHSMESSIFPLELYFEHRNYLPSVGLFMAGAGLLGWLLAEPRLQSQLPRLPRILGAGFCIYITLLAGATAARAMTWSSVVTIAQQGIATHPQSRRAHIDYLSYLLAIDETEEVRRVLENLLELDDPAARHMAAFMLPWLDCREGREISSTEVRRIEAIITHKLQLSELFASERLGTLLLEQNCSGLAKSQLASLLRQIATASEQNPGLVQIWRMRLMAARLFAADGNLATATEQAALAWMTGKADPAAGILLANLYYAQGDVSSARLTAEDVARRIKSWDRRGAEGLHRVVEHFDGREAADKLLDAHGLKHLSTAPKENLIDPSKTRSGGTHPPEQAS